MLSLPSVASIPLVLAACQWYALPMKKILRVPVARRHVVRATPWSPQRCPIALAINEALAGEFHVNYDHFSHVAENIVIRPRAIGSGFETSHVTLTPEISNLIDIYDATGEMPEFTLLLEVNDVRVQAQEALDALRKK